jgi:hypothetical protein
MALTLAAGISASARYCTVNQPPTQAPGSYYRIGDEVIQHIGYVTTTPIWTPNFTQLYIARGQLGTTAASHLSGATLTYVRSEFLSAPAETDPGPFETGGAGGGGLTVTDGTTDVAATTLEMPTGTVVDAGGGVASVGQIVSQLGPYRVNYNDPNVGTDVFTVVSAIGITGRVVNAWLELGDAIWVESALSENFHSYYIGVGAAPLNVVSYNEANLNLANAEAELHVGSSTSSIVKRICAISPGDRLTFEAYSQNGTAFVQGSADIYLLILWPSP